MSKTLNYVKEMQDDISIVFKRQQDQAMNKIGEIISEKVTKIKKEILEEVVDLIKKNDQDNKNKIKELSNEQKELKENVVDVKNDINNIKDTTYIIALDGGKRRTLTKLVNNLCYKYYTEDKYTLKDKLFHKAIIMACYKRLYNQFEINTYTSIRIDDFEEALKVIRRWYSNKNNIEKAVYNRLKDYTKDKKLDGVKKIDVDEFLSLTNGGNNLWI